MVSSDDVGPQRNLPGASEQWGRWQDERVTFLLKELESLKTNMLGNSRAISGAQDQLAAQSQDLNAVNSQPLPPSNVRITSNTGVWRPGGVPVSLVTVAWDAVTVGTRGEAVPVVAYELWVSDPDDDGYAEVSTKALNATVEIGPGAPKQFSVRSLGANGVWSEMSLPVTVTPAWPSSVVPKAPVGLLTQKNVGYFAVDNSARANVEFSWTPVTQSTDGATVKIVEYEVWLGTASDLGAVIGTTTEPKFSTSIPSSVTRHFRVRALSDIGALSDLSTPLAITGAQPPHVTTPPSTPTLTTARGIVAAYWDGLLNNGQTPQADRHVKVKVAFQTPPASGDPWPPLVWTSPAQPIVAGTAAVFSGKMGDLCSVKFVLVDNIGRESSESAVATITVQGVVGADIEANSVNANVLTVGSITVDLLEPNLGGKLDISANNMVQIIVGQQQETANAISAVNDAVSDNTQGIIDAKAAASAANGVAQSASGAAQTALTEAAEARSKIEAQQTVYQFTPTGARIQTPGGEQVFGITPDRAYIEKDGVVLTYWEGGQMVVPQIAADSANIGNHRWSVLGTTRTVVQPL